ncbi:hypothetical protein GCM10020367_37580 [Streptomyces sannanensis]|uniref:Uncharacterized protein n=1 Tax=Streptomyces sannanensis TaxID=285536 RepID=A0ABP6SE76_9ACTN
MTQDNSEVLTRIDDVKTEVSGVRSDLKANNHVTVTSFKERTAEIITAVKKGPDKEVKTLWESIFEALGLKDVVAAIKEEGLVNKILLGVAALLATFALKLDWAKGLNWIIERLTRTEANPNGRIIAPNDGGIPRLQRRADVDALAALRAIPPSLQPENISALKEKLEEINPHLRTFNEQSRQLPSARSISKTADAFGHLKEKMPTANRMNNTADAAGRLVNTTGTLRERFDALANAARTASGAIGS